MADEFTLFQSHMFIAGSQRKLDSWCAFDWEALKLGILKVSLGPQCTGNGQAHSMGDIALNC